MQDRSDSFQDDDGVFDDPVAIAAIDARADADIAADRLIGHAAVLLWLKSWGDASSAPWDGRWRG